MVLYINSPHWFNGIDSTIEFLFIIVAFLVSWYGYKVYRLCCEKKYKYFSLSFLLVGISYIFKIISELVIYEKEMVMQQIGPLIITRTMVEPLTWIHTYSHTLFRLLSLFAFLILLLVALEIKNKPTIILFTYFIIITTYVSIFVPMIYHITLTLSLGILLFHFYHNYLKHRMCQALYVTLAFLAMLISHIMMIFMMYDPIIYPLGEIIHLVGFGLLLYAFILVRKK